MESSAGDVGVCNTPLETSLIPWRQYTQVPIKNSENESMLSFLLLKKTHKEAFVPETGSLCTGGGVRRFEKTSTAKTEVTGVIENPLPYGYRTVDPSRNV